MSKVQPTSPFSSPIRKRPDAEWILRPGDRSFNALVDVLTYLDSIVIALRTVLNLQLTEGHFEVDVTKFESCVKLQCQGLLHARMSDIPIVGLKFLFTPEVSTPSGPYADGSKITGLITPPVARIFCQFYEENLSAIEGTFGKSCEKWPDIVNFCRIVRNATSHFGRVTFQSAKAPPVRWHHIIISPANNEFQLIGPPGFEVGDFLWLFKELSGCLDSHGVPLPS